jgi:hypothetical protein
VHSDQTARHSGYEKTLHRARRDFYWKVMRKDIKSFIRECEVCQRNKRESISPAGLLIKKKYFSSRAVAASPYSHSGVD